MTRATMVARVERHTGPCDFVIVGGGATGVGIAVDAASRGYEVVLLEQSDFGKGTSSRSTKLVRTTTDSSTMPGCSPAWCGPRQIRARPS